jgi:hypothetical protein
MNKSPKWLQQKAIKRWERQAAVKRSLLPGTVSDLRAFNCQSKLTSQATRKYKKIPLWELKPGDMKKSRKWLKQEAIQRRERQAAVKSSLLPSIVSDLRAFKCRSKQTSQATRKYKKIPTWELKPRDMKKSRKWLQQEAIQRRQRQAAVKRSLLPGTVSDLRAFNCQSKLTSQATRKYKKNPTLRSQAGRYEEIRKVVAARSHQAMIATGCSKKVIAPL